jgi:hypothetical protein
VAESAGAGTVQQSKPGFFRHKQPELSRKRRSGRDVGYRQVLGKHRIYSTT